MLTSVTVRGILSFGWQGITLPLRSLNVLIGANASGKSNLLDVLGLMQHLPTDPAPMLRSKGGPAAWIHHYPTTDAAPELTFEMGSDPRPLRYQVRFDRGLHISSEQGVALGLSPQEAPSLLMERDLDEVTVKSLAHHFPERDPVYGAYRWASGEFPAGRSWLTVDDSGPLIAARRLLLGIRIYQGWMFGAEAAVRQPQPADLPQDELLPQGQNLGHVLHRLLGEAALRGRVLALLRRAYEQVVDLRTAPTPQQLTFYLVEGDHQGIIPASRMSDGTLRWLALIAILLNPSPPPIICLEEPELGLHPDLIATLAELLKDASSRTQILLTTHSEALVSEFSESPEDVVVFDRPFEATEMRRLSKEKLGHWLERYSLGHVWMSGELGGKRW